jgi:outer membrane immunogenic protein
MLSGTTMAADTPAKMPVKAPMVAPPYNWSGFYAGVNIGGSWGSHDNALVTTAGVVVLTNTAKPNGVIGGGQAMAAIVGRNACA